MSKFLTADQIYRLMQRELPEGVYPDGAATAFFSTASIYAKAQVLQSVYDNLERIYDNYFPQFTDDRIEDWEIAVFGEVSEAGLTIADRQSLILNKLRKKPSITMWEILTLVANAVPEGVFVQVVPWGCNSLGGGNWILGTSRLGVNTYLGWALPSQLQVTNGDYCSAVISDGWRLNASHLGTQTKLSGNNSWQVISSAQAKAYTYEVRIFGYALVGAAFDKLVRDLDRFEPARSGRVIKQNQSLSDYGLIFSETAVTQFSGLSAIARDSLSITGYSGRKAAV